MSNPPKLDSIQASISEATLLLQTLFEKSPHDLFLEIRTVPTGLLTRKERFFRLRQLQRTGFDQAIPFHLDGKADIYFSVVPRIEAGHGGDANTDHFDRVWADYDGDQPVYWPVEPSLEWASSPETNPEKRQAVWLLARTVTRNECVTFNRRMVLATGADPSSVNAERILRLPGFINMKYSTRPRARIIRITGNLYSPEEMDSVLPSNSINHEPEATMVGKFDAHARGDDIPQLVKDELTGELRRRGASQHYDGRLTMACPFRHNYGPCDCAHAFYFSPDSGRWWCFCTDHPKREQAKTCVAGGAWSLWGTLFPGRRAPRDETSLSPPLIPRGEYEDKSYNTPYAAPPGWVAQLLQDSPRHKRTASLLRSVYRLQKAADEEKCGFPLKGDCSKHGVVRQSRASGKSHWCAGCHTETSARYTHVAFPEGEFIILRLCRELGPLKYDVAEVNEQVLEIDSEDCERIVNTITEDYDAAKRHFRRVQRRFGEELMGWSYAENQEGETGLAGELRVLVRRTERLEQVLRELTGMTRRRAVWSPTWAARYDYKADQADQLRRDWASLLKTALVRLHVDALFVTIWRALDGKQLSQAYGDLRQAYGEKRQQETDGEGEDRKVCPVMEADTGQPCGLKLMWFVDPDDRHTVNPEGHRSRGQSGPLYGY